MDQFSIHFFQNYRKQKITPRGKTQHTVCVNRTVLRFLIRCLYFNLSQLGNIVMSVLTAASVPGCTGCGEGRVSVRQHRQDLCHSHGGQVTHRAFSSPQHVLWHTQSYRACVIYKEHTKPPTEIQYNSIVKT